MGAYPAYREADVVLRDGSTVHLRPVRDGDEPALLDLLAAWARTRACSASSPALPTSSGRPLEMAEVDYADRYGLVATRGGEERLVGHGTYVRGSPDRAEVAFAIDDAMQGQGLGTILLAELDLNPVIAGVDGAVAVDARIRVSTAPPSRPWPRTWR